MAKTLQEYLDWLDERGLIWPSPPEAVPAKATPYLKPLKGIKAVTWSVYGVLLRISDGELLYDVEERMRMQVAMDKTIQEFNMWQHMFRKPGPPWEQMYEQYRQLVQSQQMAGTGRKGDAPEVDLSGLWLTLLGRLAKKDYSYDVSLYGDPEEFADKVACFFHASLQGVEAAAGARTAVTAVAEAGLRQGILSDGQAFTLVQLLRALRTQGTLPPLGQLFDLEHVTFSFQEGVRKPSPSLYESALEKLEEDGIRPRQVLHVGCRLRDDLAVAKRYGMRTALYAGERLSLRATKEDLQDAGMKPDRLMTELAQIRDILAIG